jgi:hypothetical protein
MARKTVKVSNLTDEFILEDERLVRIVVQKHPDLQDGPVEIEVDASELKGIDKYAIMATMLEVFVPGEEPRRVILETKNFDALAKVKSMADVLAEAEPVKSSRPRAASSSNGQGSKVDYATLETAGQPHRGTCTEAEAKLVRENLETINERLQANGQRTIDPSDPKMHKRYGLEVPTP